MRELVMGGVAVARARSRVDVPVLAGKRAGNIEAGGATALAVGAREVRVDMRAVCPFSVCFAWLSNSMLGASVMWSRVWC